MNELLRLRSNMLTVGDNLFVGMTTFVAEEDVTNKDMGAFWRAYVDPNYESGSNFDYNYVITIENNNINSPYSARMIVTIDVISTASVIYSLRGIDESLQQRSLTGDFSWHYSAGSIIKVRKYLKLSAIDC